MTNKRIEEIRDKCIVREGGSRIYPELFAELLIEECCKVIEGHYEPVYDGKILLMHFGIGAQGAQPDPVEVREGWEYMREKGLLQEPVMFNGLTEEETNASASVGGLTPPQRKPLTDDELETAYREIWRNLPEDFNYGAYGWIEQGIRYAERAHGIGGHDA